MNLGFDPEEQLGEVVDGETVGPHHVGVHDDLSLGAVHSCALDLRVESPVILEHESGAWVDLNSSSIPPPKISVVLLRPSKLDALMASTPVSVQFSTVDGDTVGSFHGCHEFCVGFDVSAVGEKKRKPLLERKEENKCSEIINITHRLLGF